MPGLCESGILFEYNLRRGSNMTAMMISVKYSVRQYNVICLGDGHLMLLALISNRNNQSSFIKRRRKG